MIPKKPSLTSYSFSICRLLFNNVFKATHGQWVQVICKYVLLLTHTSVVCYLHKIAITINFIISIGLLTLLSVDRYIVLVRNAWQNIRVKQRPPRIGNCSFISD